MVQPLYEVVHQPKGHQRGKRLFDEIDFATELFPEDSFYLLNEGALRERYRTIDSNFLPGNQNSYVAYAVKANSRRRILEVLSSEGMTHFDCASPNEISLVKSVDKKNYPMYNHPIKRKTDIREAYRMGVTHFTVQTKREIEKILELLRPAPSNLEIAVRMMTLNSKAACNLSTKFGATQQATKEMLKFLKKHNIRAGISVHTGSQNSDPETMREGVEKMADVLKSIGKIRSLNVGGGLPVNYLGDKEFDIKVFLEVVSQAVSEILEDVFEDDDHQIIIEPGRAIIGDNIQLVSPVIAVEGRGTSPCIYINDGIFSSFCPADPPNYKADFKLLRKDQGQIYEVRDDEFEEFIVFGRTCDSADTLGKRRLPKSVREGDWILHSTAGAYTDSCSSSFNNFNPHKWVSFNV